MCSLTKTWKILNFSSSLMKNYYNRIFLRAAYYNFHTLNRNQIQSNTENSRSIVSPNWLPLNLVRFKKKKVEPKSVPYEEEEEEQQDDDSILGKNIETKTMTINFMRIDVIIKHGLNMSRARTEKAFYEGRFRLNGKQAKKKSAYVQAGDEVDLIKEVSKENKNFLVISRIEIVSAKPNENKDAILVKIRKTKSLLIENYEDDPWKGSFEEKE